MKFEGKNSTSSTTNQPAVKRTRSQRAYQSSPRDTDGEILTRRVQNEGIRRSTRLSNQGPLGILNKFPIEVFCTILDYIPIRDIANLGQTSKAMRDILIALMYSNRFLRRLAQPIVSKESLHFHESHTFKKHHAASELGWYNIGILLKKLTTVIPTQQRVYMYQKIIYQLRHLVLKKRPEFEDILIPCMMGVVLHVLVAGWDDQECQRVYSMISQWLNVKNSLVTFLSSPLATHKKGEIMLATTLKSLFLDSCSDNDRVMWTDIIFNSCSVVSGVPSSVDQAKLVLLLSAPVRAPGNIRWDFYEEVEDVSFFIETYRSAANILERLTRLESRKSSVTKVESLQILATLLCTPSAWPIRSVTALLLSLHCLTSSLVAKYFKLLKKAGLNQVVREILTEVVFVATLFSAFDFRVLPQTVLSFIRTGLNCGWTPEERKHLITHVWSELSEISESLLDDAILAGDYPERLHIFLNIWKEICIQMFL